MRETTRVILMLSLSVWLACDPNGVARPLEAERGPEMPQKFVAARPADLCGRLGGLPEGAILSQLKLAYDENSTRLGGSDGCLMEQLADLPQFVEETCRRDLPSPIADGLIASRIRDSRFECLKEEFLREQRGDKYGCFDLRATLLASLHSEAQRGILSGAILDCAAQVSSAIAPLLQQKCALGRLAVGAAYRRLELESLAACGAKARS